MPRVKVTDYNFKVFKIEIELIHKFEGRLVRIFLSKKGIMNKI